MNISTDKNLQAMSIAKVMLDGFNRHYQLIRHYGQQAKTLFEAGDWKGVHTAVSERIPSYDNRSSETARLLEEKYETNTLDNDTWQQVKLLYIGQLINHKQPELAETFFNSVCSRLLHRTYFHNDYIFARPAVSTQPVHRSGLDLLLRQPFPLRLREEMPEVFDWAPLPD